MSTGRHGVSKINVHGRYEQPVITEPVHTYRILDEQPLYAAFGHAQILAGSSMLA
jgi:hypothetical protein